MLFCKLTSPVTVNVCQVRNLYISETTIPITPNAPKLLLTTRFLKGNHTPKTNKMTDTIPIGLSRFIKPVISCTPFNPPYWLNNIGNKLIRNAIDRIIFFFIHSHSFAKFRFLSFKNWKLFINSFSISSIVSIPNLGTICSCNPSHLLLLYIIPVLISNQSIGNKINNYFSHIWLIDIPLIIIF